MLSLANVCSFKYVGTYRYKWCCLAPPPMLQCFYCLFAEEEPQQAVFGPRRTFADDLNAHSQKVSKNTPVMLFYQERLSAVSVNRSHRVHCYSSPMTLKQPRNTLYPLALATGNNVIHFVIMNHKWKQKGWIHFGCSCERLLVFSSKIGKWKKWLHSSVVDYEQWMSFFSVFVCLYFVCFHKVFWFD